MVQIDTLQNGVRLVSEPMEHARSVSLGIWVKAGSASERQGEEGIAHFIEHMLFKGTESRSAKQIAQQFDLYGGDINAFTTKETTCYYATVLADKAAEAAEILADMLLNSVLSETEMEKEKTVILDELASVEDSPEDDADEQLWKLMYPEHPIGRPIGGTAASIRAFTRDRLLGFMDRYYTPGRIIVSVAGCFQPALLEELGRLFGTFRKDGTSMEEEEYRPARFRSGTIRKEKDIEQTHLFLGYPGLATDDPEIYTLALLDSIAGGTMSSRLFQQVREEEGLAYSVYSYYAAHEAEGAFVIGSAAAPENERALTSAVLDVIRDIAQSGVTAEELHYAKEQMRGSFLIGLETAEARMHRNGNNELLLQRHRTEAEVLALVRAVTVNDVTRMAGRLLLTEPAISIVSPNHP
ncbi:peptidase M16 [Sporosarcina sp. NCCP-2716]|uniref:M16 family metallopeptidase n=1 Tax=Sporosarcina sp. NCCP-2716 TaxID=2943679 RepID=UPI0020426B8C|nr:pitrilysin family protein [Sporosarcina sp. NCCP-2716]GKV67847.1 peptidase M16 [Sporosarcina sp. NCCP-2716]